MKCIDAFKNLFVETANGKLGVSNCCMIPVARVDHVDFQNDAYLNSVRTQWENGSWPSHCIKCKENEQHGLVSRRQGSNRWYQDNLLDNNQVELVRLDYWVGDLCNCACVICGPSFSSLWKQQLGMPLEIRKTVVNRFWKNLDLSHLKFVHFNGGEPLLNKEHIQFLNSLQNKKSITVTYNTNGTVLPSTDLQEIWAEFKLVELVFSIDDIDMRFEYQRWPAKWAQVVNNLKWYLQNGQHNWMYAVNTTVSVLNQKNLSKLDLWLQDNFATTKFTDPIEFRKQLAHGLYACDQNLDSVRRHLTELDQRRGTDWKTVFPEFIV